MVGTTDRTLTREDLRPGLKIWGRQVSSWTTGTRLITAMAGNRITYRPLSFDKGRGNQLAVRNRVFTCDVEAFLRWAIRIVGEREVAC